MMPIPVTSFPVRTLARAVAGAAMLALLAMAVPAHVLRAQTDFFNTDAGRPIETEDAHAVEYRAFELQLAPLRLERASAGVYRWGLEPEMAFGVLPRTHIEIGAPMAFIDVAGPGRTSGLAGIHLSAFHNLNAETSIPALAVVASALLPVGSLAPDRAYVAMKGIVTRTLPWARVHLNGAYTFGEARESMDAAAAELSRWTAGLAVDRAIALRSILLTGEIVAHAPFIDGGDPEWSAGAGVRQQITPRWAIDAGIGRRLTGDDRAWHATFGSAYAFGLPWRRQSESR